MTTVETKNMAAKKEAHNLIVENRQNLTATGVSNVDSFDDQTIVAYTDLGQLVIKGSNLHMNKLNTETGELTVSGTILSMTYEESQPSGGSIFSRIFR